MVVIRLHNIDVDQGLRFTEGKRAGIHIAGHAGSDIKGKDIVCSAVSVLSQTLVLSIERLLEVKQDTVIESGILSSTFGHGADAVQDEKLKLLIESFLIGVFEIQKEYPERIKIEFEVD